MQLERVGEAMVLRMRAGKANAIGPAWLERMEALLDEALAARARSLVITGYEGFFSAGLDLPALEGRLFSPEEALAVGLLHELLPPDRLEQRAVARAMELGALPGSAFATVKRGLRAPVAQRVRELASQDASRWSETWL